MTTRSGRTEGRTCGWLEDGTGSGSVGAYRALLARGFGGGGDAGEGALVRAAASAGGRRGAARAGPAARSGTARPTMVAGSVKTRAPWLEASRLRSPLAAVGVAWPASQTRTAPRAPQTVLLGVNA